MQGLADYYDKHRAVTQKEQLDAIQTYTKLLEFIERYCTLVHAYLPDVCGHVMQHLNGIHEHLLRLDKSI